MPEEVRGCLRHSDASAAASPFFFLPDAEDGAEEPWLATLRQQLHAVCDSAASPLRDYREAFNGYIEFLNLDLD